MSLCQYDSLGEYCGLSTASEVFLILVATHRLLIVSIFSLCSPGYVLYFHNSLLISSLNYLGHAF